MNGELAGKVRGVAVWAIDEKESSIEDCTAKGGPEHCPYHSRFIHAEGQGVSSHVNKKLVKNGKYIDSGEKKNREKLFKADRDAIAKWEAKGKKGRNPIQSDPTFGTRIGVDGKKLTAKDVGKHTAKVVIPYSEKVGDTAELEEFKKKYPRANVTSIKDINPEFCFTRSSKPLFGTEKSGSGTEIAVRKDGKPLYSWKQGNRELGDEEAIKLEKALGQCGLQPLMNVKSHDILVRPDFASAFGDTCVYRDGKNSIKYPKSEDFQAILDKKKNERISALYEHYDEIVHRIMGDAQEGKPEAILAYFMYRTKIRAGSNQRPKDDEGRGATTLYTGDIQFNDKYPERTYINFPAKNGFWHIAIDDKFIADFCKKRKAEIAGMGAGKNSEQFFNVRYSKLNQYLKDISKDLVGGDEEMAFRPHNFRHFAATRIAKNHIESECKKRGITYESNPEEYETIVCDAVTNAASVLNDTGKIVFDKYIIPQIAFGGADGLINKHYKFMGVKTKGHEDVNPDMEADPDDE